MIANAGVVMLYVVASLPTTIPFAREMDEEEASHA